MEKGKIRSGLPSLLEKVVAPENFQAHDSIQPSDFGLVGSKAHNLENLEDYLGMRWEMEAGTEPLDPIIEDGEYGSKPSIVSYYNDDLVMSTSTVNKAIKGNLVELFAGEEETQATKGLLHPPSTASELDCPIGSKIPSIVAQEKELELVGGVSELVLGNKSEFGDKKVPIFDRGILSGPGNGSSSYS